MPGLSGKTPLHIVQATKAAMPGPEADTLVRVRRTKEGKFMCILLYMWVGMIVGGRQKKEHGGLG